MLANRMRVCLINLKHQVLSFLETFLSCTLKGSADGKSYSRRLSPQIFKNDVSKMNSKRRHEMVFPPLQISICVSFILGGHLLLIFTISGDQILLKIFQIIVLESPASKHPEIFPKIGNAD